MAEIVPTNTTGLEAADERLKQMEAEQADEFVALGLAEKKVDTTEAGDRAPAGDQTDQAASDSPKQSETPLAAEKQEIDTARAEAEKEGKELELDDKGAPKRGADGKFVRQEKKIVEPPIVFSKDEQAKFEKFLAQKQGTKYAKDFTRRLVTWVELQSAKDQHAAAIKSDTEKLQGAVTKFNADVAEFNARKSESTPTPEKYEAFASKCSDSAKVKRAEAITATSEGRHDDAEKLLDEAKFLDRDANAAKASAEHVRKNPPPDAKQLNEKFVADQKTWIGKAVQDFPDFGKKGSELQVAVAEVFKAAVERNPAYGKIPGFVYDCVDYAANKSASSRVPALNKELGELRTKVKELEALTNPTPSGGVARPQTSKSWDSMSTDEQFEQLRQEASTRR